MKIDLFELPMFIGMTAIAGIAVSLFVSIPFYIYIDYKKELRKEKYFETCMKQENNKDCYNLKILIDR